MTSKERERELNVIMGDRGLEQTPPGMGRPESAPRQNPFRDTFKELAEAHHTNLATINNLVSGGVDVEDLDEVLELRSFLSRRFVKEDEPSGGRRTFIREDTVSAQALAEAYKAVNGDVEELTTLVNTASDLAKREELSPGLYSRTLRAVTELYRDGGLGRLYGYGLELGSDEDEE